jgi:hypothetical protein
MFCELYPDDSVHCREPALTKKLKKGNAYWQMQMQMQKLILGWIVDMVQMTLELPCYRDKQLQEIFDSIPCHQTKRTSTKKWRKVLGKLWSMSIALPGACDIFSLLQEAFHHETNKCLRLSQGVHERLINFRWLLENLQARPMRLFKLVPQSEPRLLRAGDA